MLRGWRGVANDHLGALAESAARGELEIPISKRLPLSQVREAHRLAERSTEGKILLTM